MIMSSLDNVVSAMSKETNNSTLGWDVVVNYTSKDMSELLDAAYKKGHEGQLTEITGIRVEKDDPETGDPDPFDYVFKLGAPLIQFSASAGRPECTLEIPVIGGSADRPKMATQTINKGQYTLRVSGIALASVNATKGASGNLIPSSQPFNLDSPNTTGAVTLDLGTSVTHEWLMVELEGNGVPRVDANRADIAVEIREFFKKQSIRWDLAQVNNTSSATGSTQLLPKSFRFAAYRRNEESPFSMLSIFIELEGGRKGTGNELQSFWLGQWARYDVPPIPDSYTASIIFNNAWIKDLVKTSVGTGDRTIEDVAKTSHDTWAFKWKIGTNQKFHMDKVFVTYDKTLYRIDNEVNVDLNEGDKRLYMTIGQNGEVEANALLEWEFSFDRDWSLSPIGFPNSAKWGTVTTKEKLVKKKFIDNSSLPEYKVRLDASLKEGDWDPPQFSPEPTGWKVFREAVQDEEKLKTAIPKPPGFDLIVFDIEFFMITNLLLPNQNVIEFKTDPGARFPRDLYLVGQVVHEDKVKARLAARAALAS